MKWGLEDQDETEYDALDILESRQREEGIAQVVAAALTEAKEDEDG